MADYLGPKLMLSNLRHVKILGGDDNRYIFPWWFENMRAENPISLDYLYGFSVHFYADRDTSTELFDETHRQFPSKMIINTESCYGIKPFLGSWHRAVGYILSYMEVSFVYQTYSQFNYFFVRILCTR